jgi:hypothetical protein
MTGVFPLNRAYFRKAVPRTSGLDGSLVSDLFFVASGLWPMSGREAPRPAGVPHVLRDVAKSAVHDRVRESMEAVEQTLCSVLHCGETDTLWLHVGDGIRLLKREIRDQATGSLMSRYTLRGHRELQPGVWCPTEIRSEQFDFRARDAAGKLRKVIDVQVAVQISPELQSACFDFEPGPGWLELDAADVTVQPRQATPGAIEHLLALSEWVAKYRASPPTVSFKKRNAALVVGALLVAVIVTEALLRYWPRPRSHSRE